MKHTRDRFPADFFALGCWTCLLAVACSADLPSAAQLVDRSDRGAAPVAASNQAARSHDAGMITRGAGMPIVPIHVADAGAEDQRDAAAAAMTKTPPVVVATRDAGQGGRDAAQDAGQTHDAGSDATTPPTQLELPRPIHRYTFSGEGNAVHDEHGGPDAIISGNALLDGRGAVTFPGQGDGVVKLPEGILGDVTSFSMLVWLETRSPVCWQRALDFLYEQEATNPPGQGNPPPTRELTSLYLTPYGCPDALPTVGYVNSNAKYHLISQTRIAQSEEVQLGLSFSGRSRTLRLILNGVVEREQAVPVDVQALQRAQLWLGRSRNNGDPQLNGAITELRIYDSALEDSALLRLFERGPDDSP